MSTESRTSAGRREEAIRTAVALERWAAARGWRGADPYDGLNSSRARRALGRRPLALRILTQAVKRSPLDLRPLLGIAPGLSAATLGLAASAYARNGFMPPAEATARLQKCVEGLERMRCDAFPEPCWGYHFDVQTRVFFYPRTQPNTIATAFAGLGLLDAYQALGDERWLELASGCADFFLRHVPQTAAGVGAHFGYLPGDRTPIHNANLLVCALLARVSAVTGREDAAAAGRAGVAYAVDRQRNDGSWPYGEQPGLDWIDGFHTGYVLDSLLTCVEAGIGGGDADAAWRAGLEFYARRLVEDTGLPRYTPTSRYPIDAQCAAQAIETLSRASRQEPEVGAGRWRVFDFLRERLSRGDGSFYFQRERLWTNRTPHMRWVQAPILKALAELIASDGASDEVEGLSSPVAELVRERPGR